jgi:hypothetical protein
VGVRLGGGEGEGEGGAGADLDVRVADPTLELRRAELALNLGGGDREGAEGEAAIGGIEVGIVGGCGEAGPKEQTGRVFGVAGGGEGEGEGPRGATGRERGWSQRRQR